MTYYEKNGKRWLGGKIYLYGRIVFNPTHEQLLAAGYEAVEVAPHVRTLEEAKAQKIAEIDAYDTSSSVNGFMLDGVPVWLDKATRVGLMNSLNCEKGAGHAETTLWLGSWPMTLPVERAMVLLAAVELYALECFNRTAAHKAAVEKLEAVESVDAYDYTTGYPEMLVISTEG